MNELRFRENAVLYTPLGDFQDGESNWREIPAEAAVMEMTELDMSDFGRISDGLAILLRSPEPPVPGCRIGCLGRIYDVKMIKTCRDLDGQIQAYRCAVV